jgi:hypothetical protein
MLGSVVSCVMLQGASGGAFARCVDSPVFFNAACLHACMHRLLESAHGR